MVPVDILLGSEASEAWTPKILLRFLWDNIKIVLPIFNCKSVKNDQFQSAVTAHLQFYDLLQKKGYSSFSEEHSATVWEGYMPFYEDENLRDLATANSLGLLFLNLRFYVTAPQLFRFNENSGLINNVLISSAMSNDSALQHQLTGLQESDFDDIKKCGEEFLKYLDIDELYEELRHLKKSEFTKLRDIADYYSALLYDWGIIQVDVSYETKNLIGQAMLRTQANLGNYYSKRYLDILDG